MKKINKYKYLIGALTIVMLVMGVLIYKRIGINAYSPEQIPEFSGNPSVALNNNVPEFTQEDINDVSYEHYGELDEYGRCTTSVACIGKELMPDEERGSIAEIKPTGWNQNKYPGIVDSDPPYLFNRCHVIGFQLTGQNANEKNLITGTRYLNVEGMLPYENEVAEYVCVTGNHVLYRVTPVFEGENMLCSGVRMEAYSVEDSGAGVCFNVYCYNVQPGVKINYLDGSNTIDPGYNDRSFISADDFALERSTEGEDRRIRGGESADEASPNSEDTYQSDLAGENEGQYSYIANKSSHKFHYPDCKGVADMKEKNKLYFDGSREELIEQGYEPCKMCNP